MRREPREAFTGDGELDSFDSGSSTVVSTSWAAPREGLPR